jgi:hypothetical protein
VRFIARRHNGVNQNQLSILRQRAVTIAENGRALVVVPIVNDPFQDDRVATLPFFDTLNGSVPDSR